MVYQFGKLMVKPFSFSGIANRKLFSYKLNGADLFLWNPDLADVPAPAVRGSGSLYALDLMAAYNRNMSAYDMVSNSTPSQTATTFTYDASGDMPGAKAFL